jgi:hypothetical protein
VRLAFLTLVVACAPSPSSPLQAKTAWPLEVPLAGAFGRYAADVDIGGDAFALSIDTGSTLLAVSGTNCAACDSDGTSGFYQPRRNAKPLNVVLDSRYDEGQAGWRGSAFVDRVSIAGVGAEIPVFAMSNEVGMVAAVGVVRADGILGMKGGRGSWIDAIVKTGMPDEFAIHKCDVNGTLWLGGAPAGSASFVAATPEYGVALHAIDVGSAHVELPPDTTAVVDSGVAGLVVPPAAYDAITAELDQNYVFGGWFGSAAAWFDAGECVPMLVPELLDRLPPITLVLDGITLTIPAKQAYAMPTDDEQVCPTLAARGSYVEMRTATVIFDRARHRIGFAPPTPCNDADRAGV